MPRKHSAAPSKHPRTAGKGNQQQQRVELPDTLRKMSREYRGNETGAVRSQRFIKHLHEYLESQLNARLSKKAETRGVIVKPEAKIYGAIRPKDVDVAVIDPENGPLLLIGIRSQMSSVGKNALNYYEGIVGELLSLQQRFPMATYGYIYLHPLASIKTGLEGEAIKHARFARMYAEVTGRTGAGYRDQRGTFDQFAYMVVDFAPDPPLVRDDAVSAAVPGVPLSINDFVDRMIDTFKTRNPFLDVFK